MQHGMRTELKRKLKKGRRKGAKGKITKKSGPSKLKKCRSLSKISAKIYNKKKTKGAAAKASRSKTAKHEAAWGYDEEEMDEYQAWQNWLQEDEEWDEPAENSQPKKMKAKAKATPKPRAKPKAKAKAKAKVTPKKTKAWPKSKAKANGRRLTSKTAAEGLENDDDVTDPSASSSKDVAKRKGRKMTAAAAWGDDPGSDEVPKQERIYGGRQWRYVVLPQQVLGCLSCRYIFHGCRACRAPAFRGRNAEVERKEQQAYLARSAKKSSAKEAAANKTKKKAAKSK